MDYLADMGIVHCSECGRLFRPHKDELLCAGCRGEELSPVREAQLVSPHERAAAFHRAFEDSVHQPESTEGPGAKPYEPETGDAPTCMRCRKQPAMPDARYCLDCRVFLERSLKQAAGDLFGRIREISRTKTKAKAFHVHDSTAEKRDKAPGQGPNYSGAPRYKY